jgi:hypothetical protein
VPALRSPQYDPLPQAATPQQTFFPPLESTQWPLVHCASAVHVVPSPPGTEQKVSLHAYPGAQSVEPVQLDLQVVDAHV